MKIKYSSSVTVWQSMLKDGNCQLSLSISKMYVRIFLDGKVRSMKDRSRDDDPDNIIFTVGTNDMKLENSHERIGKSIADLFIYLFTKIYFLLTFLEQQSRGCKKSPNVHV